MDNILGFPIAVGGFNSMETGGPAGPGLPADIWHSAPVTDFLLAILILVAAGEIGRNLARVLRVPIVLGELLMGILLGNIYFFSGAPGPHLPASCLLIWTVVAGMFPAAPDPMPYVVVLNPLELVQLGILLTLVLWTRALPDGDIARRVMGLRACIGLVGDTPAPT